MAAHLPGRRMRRRSWRHDLSRVVDALWKGRVYERVRAKEETASAQTTDATRSMRLSRLLKNVLERSGCAKLIQNSGPWRTKDSARRGPGFENCASLIPSRVFQQPARPGKTSILCCFEKKEKW